MLNKKISLLASLIIILSSTQEVHSGHHKVTIDRVTVTIKDEDSNGEHKIYLPIQVIENNRQKSYSLPKIDRPLEGSIHSKKISCDNRIWFPHANGKKILQTHLSSTVLDNYTTDDRVTDWFKKSRKEWEESGKTKYQIIADRFTEKIDKLLPYALWTQYKKEEHGKYEYLAVLPGTYEEAGYDNHGIAYTYAFQLPNSNSERYKLYHRSYMNHATKNELCPYADNINEIVKTIVTLEEDRAQNFKSNTQLQNTGKPSSGITYLQAAQATNHIHSPKNLNNQSQAILHNKPPAQTTNEKTWAQIAK